MPPSFASKRARAETIPVRQYLCNRLGIELALNDDLLHVYLIFVSSAMIAVASCFSVLPMVLFPFPSEHR